MGYKREFDIAFVGLKPGTHVYNYDIRDSFFESYGQQDFSNCNAAVKLSLEKDNGFMLLHFDISGTVDVDCDRCGNPLTKDLWDEFNLVVKLRLMEEQVAREANPLWQGLDKFKDLEN